MEEKQTEKENVIDINYHNIVESVIVGEQPVRRTDELQNFILIARLLEYVVFTPAFYR